MTGECGGTGNRGMNRPSPGYRQVMEVKNPLPTGRYGSLHVWLVRAGLSGGETIPIPTPTPLGSLNGRLENPEQPFGYAQGCSCFVAPSYRRLKPGAPEESSGEPSSPLRGYAESGRPEATGKPIRERGNTFPFATCVPLRGYLNGRSSAKSRCFRELPFDRSTDSRQASSGRIESPSLQAFSLGIGWVGSGRPAAGGCRCYKGDDADGVGGGAGAEPGKYVSSETYSSPGGSGRSRQPRWRRRSIGRGFRTGLTLFHRDRGRRLQGRQGCRW